jgi:hypothetical protein
MLARVGQSAPQVSGRQSLLGLAQNSVCSLGSPREASYRSTMVKLAAHVVAAGAHLRYRLAGVSLDGQLPDPRRCRLIGHVLRIGILTVRVCLARLGLVMDRPPPNAWTWPAPSDRIAEWMPREISSQAASRHTPGGLASGRLADNAAMTMDSSAGALAPGETVAEETNRRCA